MQRVAFAVFGCVGLAAICTFAGVFPSFAAPQDPSPPAQASPIVPDASATLDKSVFTATGRNETLLKAATFGRYSIAVKSDQGTAIQLVDRMAGPGLAQGSAGHADGRIDAFLDHGQYKIKLISDPHGSGNATVAVLPSVELNTDQQQLVELKPIDSDLGDHQQRSYWLNIPARRDVAIEASGRNLDDLRLWRDGKWLVDAKPGTATADPSAGQPLTVKQLALSLEPGLYRVTAYGGDGQKWSSESKAHPLHIRFGIPKLAEAGRLWQVASSTGFDRFLVPATATYFRLDIAKSEHAALGVQPYESGNPFIGGMNRVTIDKTSRDPFAETTTAGDDNAGKFSLVTVERQPGQGYRLTWFDNRNPKPVIAIGSESTGWAAMYQSGNDQDEIDPTIVIADETGKKSISEPAIASTAIKVGKSISWQRRFNLLDQTELFLEVTEPVDLSVDGEGVDAQYRIESFYVDPRYRRSYQPSGYGWQLDPGFYALDIVPKENGKGILTLRLHAQGTPAPSVESPRQAAAMIEVPFTRRGDYTIHLNTLAGGHAGVRLYNSPIALGPGITFEMVGGQTIALPVVATEEGRITATAEDGTALPLVLDQAASALSVAVGAGKHRLGLTLPAGNPRYVSIAFAPKNLQADTPLPAIDAKLLAGLPQFATLAPDKPVFQTLAQGEHATFAVPVTKPALYRLESTGIIETKGTLRTRVIPEIAAETANGTGRNFLIQRYLGEGDYQLTVGTPAQSFGPIGLMLDDTPLKTEGVLQPELWARTTLAPGEAGTYTFHIDKAGKYSLHTMGLGRDFTMRLEDSDGWPLLVPGGPANIAQDFEPGDYRMILLPGAVENRAVTLLHRIELPVERSGHGPFPVAFGEDMTNRWQEPEKDQERTPDVWQFTLPAAADVTIAIDSGMQAKLTGPVRIEEDTALSAKPWKGRLGAGKYQIAVTSVSPNNRVDYTLKVVTEQLMAGQTRNVNAPTEIPVSIGNSAPVEINSYGGSDVRARLYDQAGALVAANDDRDNDWNFSIATSLAPGMYKLQVDPVGVNSAATDVKIEQPPTIEDATVTLGRTQEITDGSMHVVPLLRTDTKPNSLIVAMIESAVPVGLSVEREQDGQWINAGTTTGINPFIALPLADKTAQIRFRIWSRDHSQTPVDYTIADVTPANADEAASLAGMVLTPIPELKNRIAALHVSRKEPHAMFLDGVRPSLQWSGAPGLGTARNPTGQIGSGSNDIWLVDIAAPDQPAVRLRTPDPKDGPVSLTIPAESTGLVVDSAIAASGTATLWQVASKGLGQAAISADDDDARLLAFGGSQSARVGITVALAGTPHVRLWQPEAATRMKDLPVALTRQDFKLPDALPLNAELTDGAFAGNDAARFALPEGAKLLSLNLPQNTAAVLMQKGTAISVIWAWQPRTFEVPTEADALILLYAHKGHAAYAIGMNRSNPAAPDRHDFSGTRVFDYMSDKTPASAYAQGAVDDTIVIGGMGPAMTHGPTSTIDAQGRPIHAFIDFKPGLMKYAQGLDKILGPDAKPIDLQANAPQTLPVGAIRIAAGPARLVRVHADVPAIFYPGVEDEGDIHPKLLEADTDYFLLVPEGKPRDLMVVPEGGDGKGTMSLSALTTTPIGEGLGPKRRIAPGEARAFSFSLPETRTVGVGVRASVDVANCTVVGPDGTQSTLGKLAMPTLLAGTSVLMVEVPASAEPTEVQPVLVGADLPGKGPPDDVKAQYLALVNRKTGK